MSSSSACREIEIDVDDPPAGVCDGEVEQQQQQHQQQQQQPQDEPKESCIPLGDSGYCIPTTIKRRVVYHEDSPAPVTVTMHGTSFTSTSSHSLGNLDNSHNKNKNSHGHRKRPKPFITTLRKCFAEALGTCMLVFVVVGSGIHATLLTDDIGIQLSINSIATAFGLYGLITILGPISGAHFNPIVSLVDVLYKDMNIPFLIMYGISQICGGILGTILANIIFEVPTTISTTDRYSYNLWISEIIATASLIMIIHGCIRTGNKESVPYAVSAWVGGGYFFTSSTIFANPAVTIARTFTDTFAGISPKSTGVYICFQVIGAIIGYTLTRFFFPKHLQPANKEDPLYRRVCVIADKEFYQKGSY